MDLLAERGRRDRSNDLNTTTAAGSCPQAGVATQAPTTSDRRTSMRTITRTRTSRNLPTWRTRCCASHHGGPRQHGGRGTIVPSHAGSPQDRAAASPAIRCAIEKTEPGSIATSPLGERWMDA